MEDLNNQIRKQIIQQLMVFTTAHGGFMKTLKVM